MVSKLSTNYRDTHRKIVAASTMQDVAPSDFALVFLFKMKRLALPLSAHPGAKQRHENRHIARQRAALRRRNNRR
ncbi:hypothetical protein [Methylocella sp. CPCC 101449]|uniref:hypothetical protein n=1 Tax=Methylocella sp. CPCC 101449 TaxID=2987531 RepID=UPI0028922A69|nr:hypothetical protein [Methylocella sp. CPCC 101449]MDT2022347.1 hypothetical protein [Methylocella sp. CPCC 101449]HEV2572925.1 hypothetical protein [Beijerinckiaceae bacterium]